MRSLFVSIIRWYRSFLGQPTEEAVDGWMGEQRRRWGIEAGGWKGEQATS
jgi:hypothetical protein